jgi:hypothetical protein
MLGYAVFLALIALLLELAARHAHRRSLSISTVGFTYHPDRDIWRCPEELPEGHLARFLLDVVSALTELEFFSHEVLESEAEEVDLLKVRFDHVVLQYSQLQWHRLEHDHYVLPLPGKRGALYLYRNKDGYLVLDGTRLPSDEAFTDEGKIRNGPIGEGFVYADSKVYKLLGPKVFSMCDRNSDAAGWKIRPAIDAQKWKLQPLYKQQGRSIPPQLTQGEASLLITMMDAQAARA